MAAVLAKGRTLIENAAKEPEVEELARVLNKMGAQISGAGSDVITVDGVDDLHPVDHAIIADRIEAGTLVATAAATGGDIARTASRDMELTAALRKMGVEISHEAAPPLRHGLAETDRSHHRTAPGFPTDMQAQIMMRRPSPRAPAPSARRSSENASCVPEPCAWAPSDGAARP
jgi:UDP-N-acetylglucosamine 1-carboxyvinyltransferase